MQETVYRVLGVLGALVGGLPIGTNLGLLHVLWMLLSGRLLATRGAVIPGLSQLGLPEAAVRRAWAARGQGRWSSAEWLARWLALVEREGRWQAHEHEGYRPVAVDVTAVWRPRLQGCPTTHYDGVAGKARPAIPSGVAARIGSVGSQRLGVPLALGRADPADPSAAAHERALVEQAVAVMTEQDALVLDRGFGVRRLQEAGAARYVARAATNFTARRAQPPAYAGRGRPATRGELVRPLARRYRGRLIPATPPDRAARWREGEREVRAEEWADLVLADAPPGRPPFRVTAIHDPRWGEPLLLVSPLALSPRALRDLYLDRWPVEQIPLAGQQLLGAARQFVSAPETCQRLPALALLAGAILTYVAATQPAVPTGSWDRRPRPTPGRLRRVLAPAEFPTDLPLPARFREKAAVTDHLPKGFWGQRRRGKATAATPARPEVPAKAA